jgi:hypothetical protein
VLQSYAVCLVVCFSYDNGVGRIFSNNGTVRAEVYTRNNTITVCSLSVH